MKKSSLLTLALLTVVVALAAGITAKLRAPRENVSKELLFPELARRINDVSAISIQGDRRKVVLEKSGGGWTIANAGNYPALFHRVRQNVISLSRLHVLEEKTDNPEFYDELGVENPLKADTPAVLVTLRDSSGTEMASLIVGSPRQSSSSKPGLYVRRTDEEHALLVEGMVDFSDEKRDWFDRNLMNIPAERVRSIHIQHPGDEALEIYRDSRQQSGFEIRGTTADKKSIIKVILNRIATGLEEMRADDVMSADSFTFPEDTIVTTISTFDGLVVTIRLAEKDDRHYAHFSFNTDASQMDIPETGRNSGSSAGVAEDAGQLDEQYSPWVYVIPEFKFDDLTMSMQDINRPFGSGQPSAENSR